MSFMAEAFKPGNHHIKPKARVPVNSVSGATWSNPPLFAQLNEKTSPAQTIGIRYERRVEKVLSTIREDHGFILTSHRWIKFNEVYAQPDFILSSLSKAAILFEVKYTYTDTLAQREFYTRLLKELGFGPVISCTICHNLTSSTPRDKIIHNFHEITQDSIWQLRI